jgi:hypothetical protein
MDNLSAHVNPSTIRHCNERNLKCWFIPAHTSHILQPNDNGVNAVLKSGVVRERDEEIRACILHGKAPSHIVSAVILHILEFKLTEAVIIGSWERTDIWPWNPDLIRELCAPYQPELSSY